MGLCDCHKIWFHNAGLRLATVCGRIKCVRKKPTERNYWQEEVIVINSSGIECYRWLSAFYFAWKLFINSKVSFRFRCRRCIIRFAFLCHWHGIIYGVFFGWSFDNLLRWTCYPFAVDTAKKGEFPRVWRLNDYSVILWRNGKERLN